MNRDLVERLREAAGMQDYDMGNGDWLSELLAEAAAALEAREGYVLVPREPTKEMQDAMLECVKDGIAINDDAHRSIRHGYRAMIAASEGKK